MKRDYSTVDAAIIAALTEIPGLRFSSLVIRVERATGLPATDLDDRTVDRRLQALRKRGTLQFKRGSIHGWSVVKP